MGIMVLKTAFLLVKKFISMVRRNDKRKVSWFFLYVYVKKPNKKTVRTQISVSADERKERTMKVRSSLGSRKTRSRTTQVVKRRGRIYVLDKMNPRNKVRIGFKRRG